MTLASFKIGDAYMKLLGKFPLRPIRDEKEYDVATAVLQDLFGRELNADQRDYLDTLLLIVQNYETSNYNFEAHETTPLQALRALMEANDMTQSDLAEIIEGGQSNASMILNGKRDISRENAKRLAARFSVDVGLFI